MLDLSRLLPGAFCSLVLGELGADVVKIEDTGGGDYLRLVPPQRDGLGGAFYALNRGKRSVAIDLKRGAGRELLLRLLPRFDVLLEGFRPGVLARLGLGWEELHAVHPRLILCSITGYGQTGPHRDRAGHDIDYLALSGALAAGGEEEGAPALPGVQIADLAGGGLWAAVRILAALREGEGTHLDVSMTEGVMSLLLPWLGDLTFGGQPLRRGARTLNGGYAGYGTYRTGDGKYVAVGALEPKFWGGLCREVGISGSAADPIAPAERQRELREQLGRALGVEPRDAWCERLASADVCVEPVLEMDELEAHPQHRARGLFYTLHDPQRGPLSLLRLPVDGEPAQRPAPRHGEHTDEVLAAEGVTAGEIAELRAQGAIK